MKKGIESAIKLLLQDLNMSNIGMIEIKELQNCCIGKKCKLGGMVDFQDLSYKELDWMVELLLRVKLYLGEGIKRITVFNHSGSSIKYTKLSYVIGENELTVVIV